MSEGGPEVPTVVCVRRWVKMLITNHCGSADLEIVCAELLQELSRGRGSHST